MDTPKGQLHHCQYEHCYALVLGTICEWHRNEENAAWSKALREGIGDVAESANREVR